MKTSTLVCIFATSLLFAESHSQLIVPAILKRKPSPAKPGAPAPHHQAPIMDIPIALPPSNQDNPPSGVDGPIIISDVIALERSINIFAGFCRDILTVSERLEDSSWNTTVLAPLNSVVTGLPRKPWQDPRDYAALGKNAYNGQDGEDRAHRNLRRFVEAHIIPTSPWNEGEKVESLVGEKIWWENKDGKKIIQPGNIEVSSVAKTVANGEVWILKGIINYA